MKERTYFFVKDYFYLLNTLTILANCVHEKIKIEPKILFEI